MSELHWPPSVIGRLTVGQLCCLMSARPPGRERIQTVEQYQAAAEKAAEW